MPVEIHQPEHPFLRSALNHITFFDLAPDESPAEWMRILPNCTTNLCFTLHEGLHSMEYGTMSNNMSTSCLRPVTFNTSRCIRMISVQFKPFAFHLFTGVPMQDLANGFPEHEVFLPASMLERTYDALYTARSNAACVVILENFMLAAWQIHQTDPRILYLIRNLEKESSTNMDALACKVNLSTRGLRNLFVRQVGISPKRYNKVKRFNQSVQAIIARKQASLTEIAVDHGYFDQAHFIRDFRTFSGISPGQFKKIAAKTTDMYNFESAESAIFELS